MRIRNTVNNIFASALLLLVKDILAYIARLVFVYTLGKTYLGVNAFMLNLLSLLSLAELGISTAINFSLYKPISEQDTAALNAFMAFYKRAYRFIGLIIAGLGLLVLPFIPRIMNGAEDIRYLSLIYLLYLFNSVSTYFISYKETLITAAQQSYKIVPFTAAFTGGGILLQIALLLVYPNFLWYLVIQIVMGFGQRLVINRYITRQFPAVDFKSRAPLPAADRAVVSANVKGMIFHKIGEYSIYGTDNILITVLVSIQVTGVYSNYQMIISAVNSLLLIIFNSATASFGNLLVSEDEKKQAQIFGRYDFLRFWLFGWSSLCFLCLFQDFIRLCFGADYLLSFGLLVVLSINNYIMGARTTINVVKQAAGIYYQDRWVPLVQAAANLIISIAAGYYIGILGIMLGTLLSGLIPYVVKPHYLFKARFPQLRVRSYLQQEGRYLGYLLPAAAATLGLCALLGTVGWLGFAGKLVVCALVPNALLYLVTRTRPECQYFRRLIKDILKYRRTKSENA